MIKKNNFLNIIFFLALFLEGLDAFSLFTIPLSWIGVVVFVSIYLYLKFVSKEGYIFDLIGIKYFLYYLVLVTLIRTITFDYDIPELATTNVYEYLALRLLKILSFYGVISITVWLTLKKGIKFVTQLIVYVGVAISLLSLYSYFSYVFDWSDFVRNRPGSGGWTQPIRRACSVLRNYGTFREPSFLAVWIAPIIPLIFKFARINSIWYLISILPILSLVLTRSLTGVVSILLVFGLVFVFKLVRLKSFDFHLVLPILLILLVSIFSNNLSYKFPALDPSMCPPESADKCNCSIYDDEQDKAKNSNNVFESIFNRVAIITSGGISGFENIDILSQYIQSESLKIFGDGLGISNLKFSPRYDELTKQVKEDEIIYKNPGQVVSFNNLYGNLYLSGGVIALLMFLLIISNMFMRIVRLKEFDQYLMSGLLLILLMFFFQAEELSSMFAIYVGLIIAKSNNE
jgi:hypothetical protein